MNKISDDELAEQYARLHSVWKVGDLYGMHGGTVHYRLKKIGVIVPMRVLTEEEKQKIRELYESGFKVGDGKLPALIEEIGRNTAVIARYVKSIGLTNRNRECTDEIKENRLKRLNKSYVEKGHPKGMLGKTHTKKTKNIMSEASKRMWDNMTEEQRDGYSLRASINGRKLSAINRERASWKAGWREIGGKRKYFRSRWEANYARYLEWLKSRGEITDWLHEPETFWFKGIKRGCLSYLPDFKVIERNGDVAFHEVKGWMDDRSKIKIRRMAKYHPKVRLIVIEEKQYRAIARSVSMMIKDWE